MKWFCPDVPEHLIVSTIDLTRHIHKGKGNGTSHSQKMPWTLELEDLAGKMRDEGSTWPEIAAELADRTGVRLSAKTVQDRIGGTHG